MPWTVVLVGCALAGGASLPRRPAHLGGAGRGALTAADGGAVGGRSGDYFALQLDHLQFGALLQFALITEVIHLEENHKIMYKLEVAASQDTGNISKSNPTELSYFSDDTKY